MIRGRSRRDAADGRARRGEARDEPRPAAPPAGTQALGARRGGARRPQRTRAGRRPGQGARRPRAAALRNRPVADVGHAGASARGGSRPAPAARRSRRRPLRAAGSATGAEAVALGVEQEGHACGGGLGIGLAVADVDAGPGASWSAAWASMRGSGFSTREAVAPAKPVTGGISAGRDSDGERRLVRLLGADREAVAGGGEGGEGRA